MNDGVALLLERMKTNPEEFLVEGMHISSKWGNLIAEHLESLDPEDANVLKAGLNKIKQQRFTEKVLEELVDPKKSKWETLGMVTSAMPSVGTTRGLYSKGIGGNATLLAQQQSTVEHMKAHIEALKAKDRDALLKKPHKTLFGKLFNYL